MDEHRFLGDQIESFGNKLDFLTCELRVKLVVIFWLIKWAKIPPINSIKENESGNLTLLSLITSHVFGKD